MAIKLPVGHDQCPARLQNRVNVVQHITPQSKTWDVMQHAERGYDVEWRSPQILCPSALSDFYHAESCINIPQSRTSRYGDLYQLRHCVDTNKSRVPCNTMRRDLEAPW